MEAEASFSHVLSLIFDGNGHDSKNDNEFDLNKVLYYLYSYLYLKKKYLYAFILMWVATLVYVSIFPIITHATHTISMCKVHKKILFEKKAAIKLKNHS